MALALTARRLRRVVARWRRRGPSGFDHEIAYWDEYFRTKGSDNADDWRARTSEEGRKGVYPTHFEPFLAELRTHFPGEGIQVLDVGSGPIGWCGTGSRGRVRAHGERFAARMPVGCRAVRGQGECDASIGVPWHGFTSC